MLFIIIIAVAITLFVILIGAKMETNDDSSTNNFFYFDMDDSFDDPASTTQDEPLSNYDWFRENVIYKGPRTRPSDHDRCPDCGSFLVNNECRGTFIDDNHNGVDDRDE